MNIYLDIDGVLLGPDGKPANFSKDFIKYILNNYPDSTYWLTTHCQGDATRPVRDIGYMFDEKTVTLLKKIKPTSFLDSPSKTSAIDYSVPFLWFDDCPLSYEKADLEKHGVLENWIEVDLRKDPDALGKLLQSFPMPIDLIK